MARFDLLSSGFTTATCRCMSICCHSRFMMFDFLRTVTSANLTTDFSGPGSHQSGVFLILCKSLVPFHLIQVCLQTVPILHRQIFRLASWLFSTVMRHRGISLKTIGVKLSMTWLPATRYLFLNSARYRKMSLVIPGREFQKWNGTARIKDTEEETSLLEARKMYRVLLNRVDTSTAPDIEWPVNPVRE